MLRHLLIVLIALPTLAVDVAPRNLRPGKPNIVFILADDLGYGDVGCYGQTKIKTPNIDQLAKEGMKFTSFYAGSTVCAPSRCALMTGFHTGHSRIRGNAAVPLQASDITWAEILHTNGYRTAAIGKWGLGNQDTDGIPTKKGFDDWFGYLDQTHAHNYYPQMLWRNEQQFLFPNNDDDKKGDYSHDAFSQAAVNFLRLNRTRPFFLYLAYTIPHANNELTKATGNGMEVPTDRPYENESWPQPEKNKAAMITRMDLHIGKILQQLKEHNLEENTIVFFSSDNGPHKEGGNDPNFFQSSGPFRGIKRDLYEGGIRVPFVARWLGHVAPSQTNDSPFAFWDLMPTVAELTGNGCPKGIDGISFARTLRGEHPQQEHETLYWEFHEGGSKQAVRMKNWKAIRLAPGKALELYDLQTDPGEKTNVAIQHPEVVSKIENYLKGARTESPHWPLKSPIAKKS